MKERRKLIRRRPLPIVPKIEGLIWLIIGASFGAMFPVATDMVTAYYAGAAPGSDHSAVPLIIGAIIAGIWGGKSIEVLKNNRFAGWIGPLIGFNMTFGVYLALGAALTGSEVYLAVLLIFGFFLFFRGGVAAFEIFGEPKLHPARIRD